MIRVHVRGPRFVDAAGRVLLLRGVNLGGDSKVPAPDGGTQYPSNFAHHRDVSFVGRPFPLGEAAEHLSRIRRWGFNCVRLLTTWEAVEHAGPGLYDVEYLEYIEAVCEAAGEHGLYVIVDFHQDVWSRMSGGDGAPGWTLEDLGMRVNAIGPSGGAHVMQHAYDYDDPRPVQPERYRPMSWPQSYNLMVNGLMWTLFFAGERLLPGATMAGEAAGGFLQRHFLGSVEQVARRLARFAHVIGFDPVNEPSPGWIGQRLDASIWERARHVRIPGLAPSAIEGLFASHGNTISVRTLIPTLGRMIPGPKRVLNPHAVSLWSTPDPLQRAGVWELREGRAVVHRPEVLCEVEGRPVSFYRDCLAPFYRRVEEVLQRFRADWLLFVEKDAASAAFDPALPFELGPRWVNATHWYDVLTLLLKRHAGTLNVDVQSGRPMVGARSVAKGYQRQLARIAAAAPQNPSFVGEFGVPMDMRGGQSYARFARGEADAFGEQERALGWMYDALDGEGLSGAQWNYSAGNRNDARVGDQWNQEDLSIFSRDQHTRSDDPYSGARAVRGFVRPRAEAIAGELVSMSFESHAVFRLEYLSNPASSAPTVIYVPLLWYPHGHRVQVEPAGAATVAAVDESLPGCVRLHVHAERAARIVLTITPV